MLAGDAAVQAAFTLKPCAKPCAYVKISLLTISQTCMVCRLIAQLFFLVYAIDTCTSFERGSTYYFMVASLRNFKHIMARNIQMIQNYSHALLSVTSIPMLF